VRLIRKTHAVAGIAVAVPAVASAQAPATFLDYKTTVPAGWTARAPSSTMRLAEYTIPSVNGEVVVYFFGKGQGGTVPANLARWKGQFSTPDGSSPPEVVTRDSSATFPITFVEYRGTYARGVGVGDASQAKAGQMLFAGIAETPRGTLFVQMFGPIDGVATQREAFKTFLKSLKE
jgi:hypothetical protein